jgi:mRNA-degrading endonuclease toxin of MazEF toxin-antitoxin module
MSRFTRCDLVFVPDPFKGSSNPRPWVIITDSKMPFPGDVLTLACTRSDYPDNHEVTSQDLESGGMPNQTTYCSPWLIATLKPQDIRHKQGTLSKSFTDKVAKQASTYIDTG